MNRRTSFGRLESGTTVRAPRFWLIDTAGGGKRIRPTAKSSANTYFMMDFTPISPELPFCLTFSTSSAEMNI